MHRRAGVIATRLFGLLAVAAMSFFALTVVPALARVTLPAYVGIWGETRGQCRGPIPARNTNAPVRFQITSYDQFEQHCDFKSVSRVKGTWYVRARCHAVGASAFNDRAIIWATAKALSVKWASEPRPLNYLRCK